MLNDDLEKLRREIYGELSHLNPREIAYFFAKVATEYEKVIYDDYLGTRPLKFQVEFREHLRDPLLGGREGDPEV